MEKTMDHDNDPLKYFAAIFVLTSVAGLAAIYRAGKVPEWERVLACTVTSGLLGVAFAMYGWEHYPAAPWTCAAVSILAGIGGMSTVDFVLTTARSFIRTWLSMSIKNRQDDEQ